jgi:hypothetical protein
MHINHDKKLIYISIDKCASSLLKEYFENVENFVKSNSSKKLFFGYKYFAIIRNPKERWISGLNQYIFNEMKIYRKKFHHDNMEFFETGDREDYFNKFDNYLEEKMQLVFEYITIKLLNNKFIFDSHTKPQSYSIKNFVGYSPDAFELLLIKLDNNLTKKIASILEKDENDLLYLNDDTYEFKHSMTQSEYKIKLLPKCQEYYSEFCENNENFIATYLDDHKLFNRAI